VARSFSGDRAQLVPIMKAALTHKGFALIDVISPCVTFNDHEGSTKSYSETRENKQEIVATDFVQMRAEITAEQGDAETTVVTMHDGSVVRLRPTAEGYDPTDRDAAYGHIRKAQAEGAIPTGLLFIDESAGDMHDFENTADCALVDIPYEKLCPGSDALDALQKEWR